MQLRLAIILFIASLMVLALKEAQAYDLECKPMDHSGTKYIVSTPHREFNNSYHSDDGHLVKLYVRDMLQPSQVEDYVTYTKGKYKVTYPLDCDRM